MGDWSTQGAVTPVKNQAQCGSCWSFSATGALEGAWKIAGHGLVSLSEQNILDCDKGGHKCQGGSMEQAFEWVKENGICSEEADPYKCADQSSSECTGSTCAASSGSCTKVIAPGDVTGSHEVGQTENALEAAVTQQPVSVAIEADKMVFQHYVAGTVLASEACGNKLDHGVLAVGYGTTSDGTKYWKVKNSWGATWGENGYLRMEKGASWSGGECGIRMGAVFPKIAGAVSAPEATGGTLKITWKDCGDASTHAKVTGVKPDTITMGKTNTVTGSGTTDEAVTGGTFIIQAKAGPITQKYSGDICQAKEFKLPLGLGSVKWDGMACPIAKGATDVKLDITLSAAIPASLAKATVSASATTSSGDKLLCVALKTAPADAIVV